MKTIKYFFYILLAAAVTACESESISPSVKSQDGFANTSGQGGSLARFSIAGDYLYVVTDKDLVTFDLNDPMHPEYQGTVEVVNGVETIFSYNNHLLLGTTTGMFVYSLDNPSAPKYTSQFSHVMSCDPVVAANNVAYVTLRNGSECGARGVDRLDVLDISNLRNPYLIQSFNMTNPIGLGILDQHLFVCDAGSIKTYDIKDPQSPAYLLSTVQNGCFDIIAHDGRLIVVGEDGVYQYQVENNGSLIFLSKIATEKL